jgi:F-type H+-transporting ATPase subunit b
MIKKFFLAALAAALFLTPIRPMCAQEAAAPTAATAASPDSTLSASNNEEQDQNDIYKHSTAVKKIGSLLGLSTEQAATVFEVTNFAVLAILLGLLAVKKLPKVFGERSATIQKDIVDARTATEEASSRLSAVEARLAKLDDQIEEKKKILAAAEQEIATATTHAQRQIQQYAAELAIEQAARKLVITAETDRLLVQNFARRLGGDDSKEGQN